MNDREQFEEWVSHWDESFRDQVRTITKRIESVSKPHNPRAAGKTMAAMVERIRQAEREEEAIRLMNKDCLFDDQGILYGMSDAIQKLRSEYNSEDAKTLYSLAVAGSHEVNPLEKYSTSQLKAELRRRKANELSRSSRANKQM